MLSIPAILLHVLLDLIAYSTGAAIMNLVTLGRYPLPWVSRTAKPRPIAISDMVKENGIRLLGCGFWLVCILWLI